MAYLGVEQSLNGRRWLGPSVEMDRASEALTQATGMDRAICQVLARAGIDAAGCEAYLAPALRDLLPDPRSLRDMETAAARFLRAVERRERIAIFADYDVDGGSSAAGSAGGGVGSSTLSGSMSPKSRSSRPSSAASS